MGGPNLPWFTPPGIAAEGEKAFASTPRQAGGYREYRAQCQAKKLSR